MIQSGNMGIGNYVTGIFILNLMYYMDYDYFPAITPCIDRLKVTQ